MQGMLMGAWRRPLADSRDQPVADQDVPRLDDAPVPPWVAPRRPRLPASRSNTASSNGWTLAEYRMQSSALDVEFQDWPAPLGDIFIPLALLLSAHAPKIRGERSKIIVYNYPLHMYLQRWRRLAKRGMAMTYRLSAILAALALLAAAPAGAQTLRWSAAGDAVSFDPNAQLDSFTQNIQHMVYDPLVRRNRELKIEPALAVSWQIVEPTRWRFKLRQASSSRAASRSPPTTW